MSVYQPEIDYFNRGAVENPRFWQVLGGRPDFSDRTVLDLGCGFGSLCVDIAAAGARRVIGLELNARAVEFAREYTRLHHRDLAPRLEFHCIDIASFEAQDVDFVVSKSTFEHVLELPAALAAIKARLRPGGRLLTGFDPLWPSPFGGHGRIHNHLPLSWLPWGHLIYPERYIVGRINRLTGQNVSSIRELGLNQLGIRDYRRIFSESGLRCIWMKTNTPAGSWRGKLMRLLARAPFMETFMTYNLFAEFERAPN